MKDEPLLIISDCNKGLNGRNVHLGLSKKVLYINCYYYIKENMIKGWERWALSSFFWVVAWAKIAIKLAYYIQKLCDISPSAFNYL